MKTTQPDHDHDVCPKCRAELCGGLIRENIVGLWTEEQIVEMYGPDACCYSRLIGIEIPERYDGVSYWKCPDCGYNWPAF